MEGIYMNFRNDLQEQNKIKQYMSFKTCLALFSFLSRNIYFDNVPMREVKRF